MTQTRAAADPTIDEIVKTVHLDHGIERVWRAISDPAEVGQWFPTKSADWTLAPGEFGTMVWHATDEAPEIQGTVRIEIVEPPTRFVWSWGHESPTDPITTVEFLLVAADDGGTKLTVRESGFARAEQRADNVHGWDIEIGELAEYLDTGMVAPKPV